MTCKALPEPPACETITAAAASPKRAARSGSSGFMLCDTFSLLHTSTWRCAPAKTSRAATSKAARKERQVALTSKQDASPSGTPNSRCTKTAVHGIASCGVLDAPIIAVRSPGARPAIVNASRAAAAAITEDDSPIARRRSRTPVRSKNHHGVRPSCVSRSVFVTIRGGRYDPIPAMRTGSDEAHRCIMRSPSTMQGALSSSRSRADVSRLVAATEFPGRR